MAENTATNELYSAVLLPGDLGRRFTRPLDAKGNSDSSRMSCHSHDGSALPFMVEELVGQGAIHLAIDSDSAYFKMVDFLPEQFRKRIWKIDENHAVTRQLNAVLDPFFVDLGGEMTGPSGFSWRSNAPEEAILAISNFARDLRSLLLGLKYQLQVPIDLARASSRLSIFGSLATSANSRVHLAMLRQIFGAYEQREVRQFELRPASASQRAEVFQRFVEDAEYKHRSAQSRLFGFPALAGRALTKFDNLTDTVSRSSPLRHLFVLAGKTIEIATRIPSPDSKMFESLIIEPYLPPIVSLRDSVVRARRAWRSARPPFLNCYGDDSYVADDDQGEYPDEEDNLDMVLV